MSLKRGGIKRGLFFFFFLRWETHLCTGRTNLVKREVNDAGENRELLRQVREDRVNHIICVVK